MPLQLRRFRRLRKLENYQFIPSHTLINDQLAFITILQRRQLHPPRQHPSNLCDIENIEMTIQIKITTNSPVL